MTTLQQLKSLEENARLNLSYEEWRFYKDQLEKYVTEQYLLINK